MLDTKLLRSKLILAGFTAHEFGQEMSWTSSTTYRKINGSRPFTVPEVAKARQVLNLMPEEVMAIFFESDIS